MSTAANIQGQIRPRADGTWTYTWSWSYAGNDYLGDVHEEFIVTNSSGMIIDYKTEQTHSATPGQTYIGGGMGNRKIPPGDVNWTLRVIQGDSYLGMIGGSFPAGLSSPA